MNKKSLAALVALMTMTFAASPVHAKIFDLSVFTSQSVDGGNTFISSNFAQLFASSYISSNVSGLVSFEWKFSAHDYLPFNDYGYVSFNGGVENVLSNVAAVGNYGDSGWQTYTLATPFTGNLVLGVNNSIDFAADSELNIRNVAAVPEPEEWAMMAVSIPLVGWQIRRKQKALALMS
ncbi:MAG: hypothetical protein NTX45_01950 [Proteobacteria bacterium]|nr:hypothetical protein [Pseudomonadota bacterium]